MSRTSQRLLPPILWIAPVAIAGLYLAYRLYQAFAA